VSVILSVGGEEPQGARGEIWSGI